MSEENQLSDSDEELQEHLAEVQTLLARHKLVEDLVQRQEGPRHDLVEDLVHKQHLNELQRRLEPMHPADVAYILEALPLDERLIVWDLVKAERDGEILLEVSDAVRETLIESMERTELVAAADGSIAALLGASPGASVTVSIMLDLIHRCFPQQAKSEGWSSKLDEIFPALAKVLATDAERYREVQAQSNQRLQLDTPSA